MNRTVHMSFDTEQCQKSPYSYYENFYIITFKCYQNSDDPYLIAAIYMLQTLTL